jgi:hypothetical protein
MKKYLLLTCLIGCGGSFTAGIPEGGTHNEAGSDVVLPGIDGDVPEGGLEDSPDDADVGDAGHHPHHDAGHDSSLPPDDAGHDAGHDAGPCSSTPTYEVVLIDEGGKMSTWPTPETCCGIAYTCACLTALPALVVCQGMGTNVGGCAETVPIQIDCT